MSPYASIIIPTKNAGKQLDSVFEAIFKNFPHFSFEVIVVDSGSTDATKDMISKYPVKLIEIPPSSFSHGGARNLGARSAEGKILVFLTQDAVPADNWLSSLVKDFEDSNVAGVFGSQLPKKDSSPLEKFFLGYLYPDRRIIKDSINPDDCLLSEIFFSNVNSAVRKSLWQNTRFNEKLIMSEDQEWSKNMLMKRMKIIYEPSAAVYHSHKYTFAEIIRRNFDSGMSLKGMVNAPLKRSFRCEMDYLKSGFSFFLKNKSYLSLLVFPFYETARMLGFFLGFHNRFLPLFLKKFLSQNKAYWRAGKKA